MTTSMSSHSIPLLLPSSFPPLYGARYSETTANTATVTTYGGLVAMEDSHEDDPESILDDHVSRVMKTPGCQSPGATNSTLGGGGRHTPPKSSRSPDGGVGPPHYPPHRGGGHSAPPAAVKGRVTSSDWRRCWKKTSVLVIEALSEIYCKLLLLILTLLEQMCVNFFTSICTVRSCTTPFNPCVVFGSFVLFEVVLYFIFRPWISKPLISFCAEWGFVIVLELINFSGSGV